MNGSVTIVSDYGANVNNAITGHLKKHHHPFVGHTLNLITKEALNENENLKKLILKCKSLVGRFKHSAHATAKLIKCHEDMGLTPLKVKQTVDT